LICLTWAVVRRRRLLPVLPSGAEGRAFESRRAHHLRHL